MALYPLPDRSHGYSPVTQLVQALGIFGEPLASHDCISAPCRIRNVTCHASDRGGTRRPMTAMRTYRQVAESQQVGESGDESGRLLGSEGLEGLVQEDVGGRRRLAELDVGFVHGDRGFEALLVERRAGRREEAGGRQPQSAAVGQLDELLRGGAADRVFAN